MTSKVLPMKPTKPTSPPTVTPEAGWELHSEHGFMRCGPGPNDRLVRIADVVLWLMNEKELSCGLAVEAVCNALFGLGASDDQLFIVDTGNAKPVTQETSFFYVPIVSFWEAEPTGTTDDLGLPGAVKAMRTCWGNVRTPLDETHMGSHLLKPLAVRFELAHKLWGWGTVGAVAVDANAASTPPTETPGSSTNDETIAPAEAQKLAFVFTAEFDQLCEARKGRKGDAWADDEKATLCEEVGRFPKRKSGLHEAMAKALGLGTAEAVRLKVREYKQAQADARKSAAKVTQVRDGKRVVNQ